MSVLLAVASGLATLSADGQQEPAKAPQSAPPATSKPKPSDTAQKPPATAPAGADQPAAMPPDAAAKTPQEQLEEDCANLDKMSRDLKAEMDRTPPDALSLAVIHKALAIEQLSQKIQQEMKAEEGSHSQGEPEKSRHEEHDKKKNH